MSRFHYAVALASAAALFTGCQDAGTTAPGPIKSEAASTSDLTLVSLNVPNMT